MKKRLAAFTLFAALVGWFGKDGTAQNPPTPIAINQSQVIGGIAGDCLKVNTNRSLGQQACGGGSVTLAGNVTGPSGSNLVVKVQNVTYSAVATTNSISMLDNTGNQSYVAAPNCATTRAATFAWSGTWGCLGGNVWDIGASFDGGGSAIINNSLTYFTFVHPACTIGAWNATVDTGTITFDVWKIATGTAIPTVTNTIVASAAPAIASGTAIHSTTLTGWTTSVSQNDIFGVKVTAISGATLASLDLQCTQI